MSCIGYSQVLPQTAGPEILKTFLLPLSEKTAQISHVTVTVPDLLNNYSLKMIFENISDPEVALVRGVLGELHLQTVCYWKVQVLLW